MVLERDRQRKRETCTYVIITRFSHEISKFFQQSLGGYLKRVLVLRTDGAGLRQPSTSSFHGDNIAVCWKSLVGDFVKILKLNLHVKDM